jgi:DNA-binding MarR family transcriptional regulator/GNAT superfamily N-acetyltransferase
MDAALVEQVRRFNRAVTQRVGVLNDHYLGRDRPLGESRVLWEVGADGRDIRALRSALDLDSGYLSRMIASLERAALVTVGAKPTDRRVRFVRLTQAGLRERALLDRKSDELAESLLAPLNDRQRSQLCTAMADVERLLTAGLVETAVVAPTHPHATYALEQYFAELDRRFDIGFDPAASLLPRAEVLVPPNGLMLVARLRAEPVGCGALKLNGTEPAEIKRMWVAPQTRGLGVGRRLLAALEAHAREAGASAVRLETNKALVEAIALYRSSGYTEVPAFNDEVYGDHWFEKRFSPTPPRR